MVVPKVKPVAGLIDLSPPKSDPDVLDVDWPKLKVVGVLFAGAFSVSAGLALPNVNDADSTLSAGFVEPKVNVLLAGTAEVVAVPPNEKDVVDGVDAGGMGPDFRVSAGGAVGTTGNGVEALPVFPKRLGIALGAVKVKPLLATGAEGGTAEGNLLKENGAFGASTCFSTDVSDADGVSFNGAADVSDAGFEKKLDGADGTEGTEGAEDPKVNIGAVATLEGATGEETGLGAVTLTAGARLAIEGAPGRPRPRPRADFPEEGSAATPKAGAFAGMAKKSGILAAVVVGGPVGTGCFMGEYSLKDDAFRGVALKG